MAIKKSILSKMSLCLALVMAAEALFPPVAIALTSGPTQPEVQGFTPAGTSDMVDLFSGDFKYNIPLLDVGGYPINISYNSGITSDQEASWVGLGWNLNVGAVNRNMRAIPDDFKGDEIVKETDMKANHTYGASVFPNGKLFGINLTKIKFNLGLKYNNFTGFAFDMSAKPSMSLTDGDKGGLSLGLGLSAGSESGVGITPTLSYSHKLSEKKRDESVVGGTSGGLSVGFPYNSRSGLKSMTLSADMSKFAMNTIKNSKNEYETTKNEASGGGSSSISFAGNSYSPSIGMPMLNVNLTLGATLGGAIMGTHPNLRMSAFYSGQFLYITKKSVPAYGYQYAGYANKNPEAMHDFNREKDGAYNEHITALPLATHSYDIYSVSGQGIGGTYRPFRGDIGTIYDTETNNYTAGLNFPGIEIGVTQVAHNGANFSVNTVNSGSGIWSSGNDMADLLNFRQWQNGNATYEPVYFKQAGDKSADTDPTLFDDFGGFDAVRTKIRSGSKTAQNKLFIPRTGHEKTITRNTRIARQYRNEHISLLTAEEADVVGVHRQIPFYKVNTFEANSNGKGAYANEGTYSRLNYPKHHTSEIVSYRTDGARYVFGIPAYNTMQREVSFNISASNLTEKATGITAKSMDPSNKYMDKTTTPPFAHGYLLTNVLSADYVDVTGNGPSEDDLGTYTQINYGRIKNSKWRTPYKGNNVSSGLNNDDYDDKASYVYGEKDIWYVHSIETKTHVAEFHLMDREDAIPVIDEATGGKDTDEDTDRLKALKKIVLYAKKERFNADGTINNQAKPIKCVIFEYDYSLCPNIINNSGAAQNDELFLAGGVSRESTNINVAKGKLTLKKIYFTYGNSKRGALNPYVFTYNSFNPPYNMRSSDRWGNYTPVDLSIVGLDTLRSYEFPYTKQNATLAAQYASAWSLQQVKLPSGGVINVTYEADDYAYVQDKRAMQMFTLEGLSSAAPSSGIIPTNVGGSVYAGTTEREYVYFKLQQPIATADPGGTGKTTFANKYLKETPNGSFIPFLYFKFLFKITSQKFDYVPGYIKGDDITDWGICRKSTDEAGTYTYGYIKVKQVTIDDPLPTTADASPFAHGAWNFTKLYLPRIAFDQPDISERDPVVQIFQAIGSTFKQIGQTVVGFNLYMKTKGACNEIIPFKSFIRLYSPENRKFGGGIRVKQISMSDEFANMVNSGGYQTVSYGQEYTYTTKDGYGNMISSGVASYEPIMGGEENPFRQPVAKKDSKLRVPSGEHVQEAPFGETFFPSPSVGYSEVTVKNLQYANVTKTATGKVVHEFYTAKDFPTIVRQTGIEAFREKGNPVFSFLQISSIDKMTTSQGYCIELNDMHGKSKGQKVFQQFDMEHPVSGVTYYYATDPENPKRLLNRVYTINNIGRISKQKTLVGYDYDIAFDAREQSTTSITGGLNPNMESFIALLVPCAVPTVLPEFSSEKTRFRSVVLTKVINQYGIQTETVAFDNKSNIKTENMLWDKETGEVLLTRTINNFEDPVYSFTYPAHWVYDGMGQAYKNANIRISVAQAINNPSLFTRGDEIIVGGERYWVAERSPLVKLIDEGGAGIKLEDFDIEDQLIIIRSGRRNQQGTSIGSVTCLTNPLKDSGSDYYTLDFQEVIAAGATEFSDKGDLFCECGLTPGMLYNPFLKGTAGNWRSRRAFTYLTGRTQSLKNGNVNTRNDGVFSSFSPFWVYNGSGWGPDFTNWTFVSEATLYSPYGYSLEDKDALGRYSGAVYGYNHQLPVAVGANARYQELGFESFEDYDYYDCNDFDRHFSFKKPLNNADFTGTCTLSNSKSHTGRSSLRLKNATGSPGAIKITKIIEPCPQ